MIEIASNYHKQFQEKAADEYGKRRAITKLKKHVKEKTPGCGGSWTKSWNINGRIWRSHKTNQNRKMAQVIAV